MGLPQGSVLSPHLFNLFIDTSLRELEKVDLDFWAYADDVAFGFRNEEEYDKKIKIINQWCSKYEMALNHNKCELMITNNYKWYFSPFPIVKTIRYLGVYISKTLNLMPHVQKAKAKIVWVTSRLT